MYFSCEFHGVYPFHQPPQKCKKQFILNSTLFEHDNVRVALWDFCSIVSTYLRRIPHEILVSSGCEMSSSQSCCPSRRRNLRDCGRFCWIQRRIPNLYILFDLLISKSSLQYCKMEQKSPSQCLRILFVHTLCTWKKKENYPFIFLNFVLSTVKTYNHILIDQKVYYKDFHKCLYLYVYKISKV